MKKNTENIRKAFNPILVWLNPLQNTQLLRWLKPAFNPILVWLNRINKSLSLYAVSLSIFQSYFSLIKSRNSVGTTLQTGRAFNPILVWLNRLWQLKV